MRSAIAIAVMGLLIVMAGCEREVEQVVEKETVRMEVPELMGEPPEVEGDVEEEPEEIAPQAVDFSTWPGREEQTTFELMWLGGDEAVVLREAPRPDAEEVTALTWLDSEELEWDQTNVYVDSPRHYRSDEKQVVTGIPYDVEFQEIEANSRDFEVAEGEVVYLYQYAGEGMCYLGIAEEIVVADCPGESMSVEEDQVPEAGAPWSPLSQQWWVLVAKDGQQGWLLVDEAPVEVHPRRLEGFDRVDDFEERY